MPTVIHGPRANYRVTCDSNPQNARSESDIAVNPLNPYNMVGSSKRFTDINAYAFSLAAYATFDGGQTWTETVLPLTDTNGTTYPSTTDPAVAFDDVGNCYIVALPWRGESGPNAGQTIGISIYRSTDGGRSWPAPVLIHSSTTDDKQAVWADTNPGSPHKGNVYAAWDNTDGSGQMLFARTTDHGSSWKGIQSGGVDQPAGTAIPGIFDSFSPEITVASNGTVIITWVAGSVVKMVTSTDGGATFSSQIVVASGITNLSTLPNQANGWPVFPGATFRLITFAACSTSGNNLTVVWADNREGVSRIYYRHSPNLGGTWSGPASGQPLLTGSVASGSGMNDFHSQIATAPSGEMGVVFYEYGLTAVGELYENLINVYLAVSTDQGATFTSRVIVSDMPWNPALDAPHADADPIATFIGDYFGLAASSLGFFPFWTDTRTGIQEMFIAHLSLYPADLYIRDNTADSGNVPSPGPVFWESPDIVVRHQPDGGTHFSDQGLLPGQDNYVYGRAANLGPNDTSSATLAITVGNFPSLLGLPGSEFWYPQDWYPGDWNTTALVNNHLYLGESAPVAIPNGGTAILGPVVWPAAQIPPEGTWHPCILAEIRCGNDDSAGGINGGEIPADPADTCPHGSFVYGNNNAAQRNETYATVHKQELTTRIEFPFIVGSVWDNKARAVELIVDKGHELAQIPMTLRLEPIPLPGTGGGGGEGGKDEECCEPGEIVFTGHCKVIVRVGECVAGEIITTPGTIWRAHCPQHDKAAAAPAKTIVAKGLEAKRSGVTYQLNDPRSVVSFTLAAQELRKATLYFTSPPLEKNTILRITERKGGTIVTGGVSLRLHPK